MNERTVGFLGGSVLALLFSAAGAGCEHSIRRADVVFFGPFVTLDSARPEAEAIAVVDGRIVAVGGRGDIAPWVGADTREEQLPGFAEAHRRSFRLAEHARPGASRDHAHEAP